MIPVADRGLKYVEGWDLADIGIGTRTEAQFVRVRGEPYVHRKYPKFLEHLQNPCLCRNREREQHEVDAGPPGELKDVVHLSKLRPAGTGFQRTRVIAVIEHTENFDVGILLAFKRLDQLFTVLVRTDNHRAALKPALP